MSSLLKKALPLLVLLYTVLGESTQDETICLSKHKEELHEIQLKLVEQSVKISYLEKDISKQETTINELSRKAAMQDVKIAQEVCHSRQRQECQLPSDMQQLNNNVKEDLLNMTKYWNISISEMAVRFTSEIMSNMNYTSETKDVSKDEITVLQQSVENLEGIVTRIIRENQERQRLQNDVADNVLKISESLNKRMTEITDQIKSEVMSTMQNLTDRDVNHAVEIMELRRSVENLTDLVTKTSQGQWLSWTAWSYCPPSGCNGNTQSRIRTCFDNVTQQEVNHCSGPMLETRRCNSTCKDCKALYDNGVRQNGVYTITLSPSKSFDVYCDMDDGGWTVIQNRFDGSVNFTRGWSDYRNGFGSLEGEFWLGLNKIYDLTYRKGRMLKLDMKKDDQQNLYALYTSFSVGSVLTRYTLQLGSFHNGTISRHSFTYNNNQKFKTFDFTDGNHCPGTRHGGWWYGSCTYLHLNGQYGVKNKEAGLIEHYSGYNNLIASRMKVQ